MSLFHVVFVALLCSSSFVRSDDNDLLQFKNRKLNEKVPSIAFYGADWKEAGMTSLSSKERLVSGCRNPSSKSKSKSKSTKAPSASSSTAMPAPTSESKSSKSKSSKSKSSHDLPLCEDEDGDDGEDGDDKDSCQVLLARGRAGAESKEYDVGMTLVFKKGTNEKNIKAALVHLGVLLNDMAKELIVCSTSGRRLVEETVVVDVEVGTPEAIPEGKYKPLRCAFPD